MIILFKIATSTTPAPIFCICFLALFFLQNFLSHKLYNILIFYMLSAPPDKNLNSMKAEFCYCYNISIHYNISSIAEQIDRAEK